MSDVPMLPPDKGSPYRMLVDRWDALWHARYRYQDTRWSIDTEDAESAPGYTRSWSLLVSGLFQRSAPTYGEEQEGPLDENRLSALLKAFVTGSCGFGVTVMRPVSDGQQWWPSIVRPTRAHIDWVIDRPHKITLWDYAADPRFPARDTDATQRGLAIIEQWEAADTGPGTVTTQVWTTQAAESGRVLVEQIDTDNPPAELADHPFVVSAANDDIRRDMVPFVWEWEDLGPVPLYFPHERTIEGLARSWDQEQDDSEMTRHRIAMPEDALGTKTIYAADGTTLVARPGFRKHDNLLTYTSAMSAEHGGTGGVNPIQFDDSLVPRDRQERRENTVLELCGINPQSIGRSVTGRSDSGTAKRVDNQMTMNTVTAPARRVEAAMTVTVNEIARLNSTTGTASGLVVQVHEGLKESPLESAKVAGELNAANAASTEQRVRVANPGRSDEWVAEEVARIEDERAAAVQADAAMFGMPEP